MSLNPSAQRVQDALMKFGLTLQVVEFPESTRSAAEAAEAIGCTVGHNEPFLTFIDEDLLTHTEIWAAAGTPNAVFRLTGQELVWLTGGKVMMVK